MALRQIDEQAPLLPLTVRKLKERFDNVSEILQHSNWAKPLCSYELDGKFEKDLQVSENNINITD